MNHLKRAWLSVTRRKGKTLILLVVVFILGNIIAGAFSVSQASKRVETNIKTKLGADASLGLDWELVEEAANEAHNNGLEFDYNFDQVDLKTLEEVAKLPQVKQFDYLMSGYVASSTVKNTFNPEDMGIMPRSSEPAGEQNAFFSIEGVNKSEFVTLAKKEIEIISGSTFSAEQLNSTTGYVLVSEKFASVNGKAVGDTFEVFLSIDTFNDNYEILSTEKVPFELTITGIFKPLAFEEQEDKDKEKDKDQQMYMENMYDNLFYSSTKFVYELNTELFTKEMAVQPFYEDITLEQRLAQSLSHTYVLNSPEDIDSFKSDASVYLPKYFSVSVSSDAYDTIAAPIQSLNKLSTITLVVAIGASVMILSLVIVLFLRDRKHELGIYLSLGDKRNKVVSQILMEVMMIALLGFTLSIFTGNLIAKSLSSTLVNQEKFDNNNGIMQMYGSYGQGNVNPSDLIDAYSVELNLTYILGFYAIGLSVVALSAVVPTVYITRLNPKKIMM